MGHTLVACFDEQDLIPMMCSLSKMGLDGINKIPFGRKCNREEANRILPYHTTLFHWNRLEDSVYLEKTKKIVFSPCKVLITGVHILPAEEDSSLLYCSVFPDKGFNEIYNQLEQIFGGCSSFFHITIAVSKDKDRIKQMKHMLDCDLVFPFTAHIRSLELFHIWEPCKRVRVWR